MASKKSSNDQKAKLRRRAVKTSAAKESHTIAELRQQLAQCMQLQNATASENEVRHRGQGSGIEQDSAEKPHFEFSVGVKNAADKSVKSAIEEFSSPDDVRTKKIIRFKPLSRAQSRCSHLEREQI